MFYGLRDRKRKPLAKTKLKVKTIDDLRIVRKSVEQTTIKIEVDTVEILHYI